jgi:hypothetical protein
LVATYATIRNAQVVVRNDANNTDLFWALRGGGASTWGMVIDVTFCTYIRPKVITIATFGSFGNFTKSKTLSFMASSSNFKVSLQRKGGLDTVTFQVTPFSVVILAYT